MFLEDFVYCCMPKIDKILYFFCSPASFLFNKNNSFFSFRGNFIMNCLRSFGFVTQIPIIPIKIAIPSLKCSFTNFITKFNKKYFSTLIVCVAFILQLEKLFSYFLFFHTKISISSEN